MRFPDNGHLVGHYPLLISWLWFVVRYMLSVYSLLWSVFVLCILIQ